MNIGQRQNENFFLKYVYEIFTTGALKGKRMHVIAPKFLMLSGPNVGLKTLAVRTCLACAGTLHLQTMWASKIYVS